MQPLVVGTVPRILMLIAYRVSRRLVTLLLPVGRRRSVNTRVRHDGHGETGREWGISVRGRYTKLDSVAELLELERCIRWTMMWSRKAHEGLANGGVAGGTIRRQLIVRSFVLDN